MKRFFLIVGIFCLLSFALAGCREAPDNKNETPDQTSEDAINRVEPALQKTGKGVEQAGTEIRPAVEEAKKSVEEGIETAKKEAVDTIDKTAEIDSAAAKEETDKTEHVLDETNQNASEATNAATSMVAEKVDTPAGVIEMKNTDAFGTHKMGIVLFSHKKHFIAMPDGYGIACGECHHDENGKPLELKEGDEVHGCMDCHDKPGKPKKPSGISRKDWDAMQLEYYYGAIHGNCIDCHKSGGAAPVKCAECHPRPES